MGTVIYDNWGTTLSAGITAVATSIPLTAAFPTLSAGQNAYLTLADPTNTILEVIQITTGGSSPTAVRGVNGVNQAWPSGTTIELRDCAEAINAVAAQSGGGGSGPAVPNGFMGLFEFFPGTSKFVANSASVAAAYPFMTGARFSLAVENFCQNSAPGAAWASDISNIAGYSNPFGASNTSIRLVGDPPSGWDISNTAKNSTYVDAVIAGAVSVANAAGINDFIFDGENYSGSIGTVPLLTNFNYGASAGWLQNSGSYTRAQMAAYAQKLGHQIGESLWSRIPNATLSLFISAVTCMNMSNPAGFNGIYTMEVPAAGSATDSTFSGGGYYNLLPYFLLGLLDACPPTGRIIDYNETSYGWSGYPALARYMNASKHWVEIFFPNNTGLIEKAKTCWIPVPLIYLDNFFTDEGSWMAGAHYVTNLTDQETLCTRNALYALQACPLGYLPAFYTDSGDLWSQSGTLVPMNANWKACLANALALFNGTTTWAALGLNMQTFYNTFYADLSSRSDLQSECS